MNGLLIDYEWCTGCHTCEIACQQEHGFAPRNVLEKGKVGISPYEIGPHDLGNGRFQYEFLPVPTALCDLCADRVRERKAAYLRETLPGRLHAVRKRRGTLQEDDLEEDGAVRVRTCSGAGPSPFGRMGLPSATVAGRMTIALCYVCSRCNACGKVDRLRTLNLTCPACGGRRDLSDAVRPHCGHARPPLPGPAGTSRDPKTRANGSHE